MNGKNSANQIWPLPECNEECEKKKKEKQIRLERDTHLFRGQDSDG